MHNMYFFDGKLKPHDVTSMSTNQVHPVFCAFRSCPQASAKALASGLNPQPKKRTKKSKDKETAEKDGAGSNKATTP